MTSAVYTTYFWIQDQSGNANTFTVTIAGSSANVPSFDVYYSTDLTTWTQFGNSQTGPSVTLSVNFTAGSKVYLKAVTNRWGLADSAQSLFGFTSINANKKFEVGGNIMSLIYGDQFVGKKTFPDDTILGIFNGLFVSKTNLVNAEELVLPVTHSTSTNGLSRCYRSMFDGCTGLTNGPMIDLRAKNNNDCPVALGYMFRNCTSLKTIRTCLQFTASRYDYTFSGVTSTGVLHNYSGTDFTTILPQNWTQKNIISLYLPTYDRIVDWNSSISGNVKKVVDSHNITIWEKADYTEPFYVENITNSTETMNIVRTQNDAPALTIEYSLDNSTWSTLGTTSIGTPLTYTLNPGDKLYLRCSTATTAGLSDTDFNHIIGVSKIGGNILSLLYGSNFTGDEVSFPLDSGGHHIGLQFLSIFKNNTTLRSAADLLLPVNNLTMECYGGMFYGCTSLTVAPNLPATNLNLLCYAGMFYGCTSLTVAPNLPATNLSLHCYESMFENCTSLITAPVLSALNLVNHCYKNMFNGCVTLNNIKCLATSGTIVNTPADETDPTYHWTNGVAATGTFYKAAGINWHSGIDGIPSGWTVVEV